MARKGVREVLEGREEGEKAEKKGREGEGGRMKESRREHKFLTLGSQAPHLYEARGRQSLGAPSCLSASVLKHQ